MSTQNPSDSSPRKLKILMLHGYTQSGPLFHAKTRALEKALLKAFPSTPAGLSPLKNHPGGIQLIYPTGPLKLIASDIPGSSTSSNEETDNWGWWRKNDSSGEYTGLSDGLSTIANAITEAGGVDGVIGFSQGAAAATMVASLLDEGRLEKWDEYIRTHPTESILPFPESFLLQKDKRKPFHPPLKFAVSYSGFYAPHSSYKLFYTPKIQTPVLHFIGTLDSVVEESRSLGSAESCVGWDEGVAGWKGGKEGEGKRNIVFHPGGHFVPIGKEMVGVLVGFIREVCGEGGEKCGKVEERVEDMDMPF